MLVQVGGELVDAGHLLAVRGQDGVAAGAQGVGALGLVLRGEGAAQAGRTGGAVRGDERHVHALVGADPGLLGHRRRQVHAGDTEPRVADGLAVLERADLRLGGVDGDGESDAHVHVLTGRVLQQRVDAHDLTLGVEQWPARVAGVNGGVGLDHAPDRPRAGAFAVRAVEPAHDALRQRALEVEGVADSQDLVAHSQLARVAERCCRQLVRGGVDLEDRDVVGGVGPGDGGRRRGAVIETHLDAARAVHHVVVGKDVSVRIDDDAGARALSLRTEGPAAPEGACHFDHRRAHLVVDVGSAEAVSAAQRRLLPRVRGRRSGGDDRGRAVAASSSVGELDRGNRDDAPDKAAHRRDQSDFL